MLFHGTGSITDYIVKCLIQVEALFTTDFSVHIELCYNFAMTEKSGETPKILIAGKGMSVGEMKSVAAQDPEKLSEADKARLTGRSFAEAMGSPEPRRQLESFEKYEEFGTEFHIKPGVELPFMVLYQHDNALWEEKRLEWEYRSILATCRSRKNNGGSVDSVTNPAPEELGLDPLGVEVKKERLEFLWREMPGLLPATALYTEITAGHDFVGFMPGERAERRQRHEPEKVAELSNVRHEFLGLDENEKDILDWGELGGVYSEAEIKNLKEEQAQLAKGTPTSQRCPDGVYGASEPEFYVLRKSLRFFLKTKGVQLLFKDDSDRNSILHSESKSETLANRAREAEQVAWNFIYTTGIIECNNTPDSNQYIREHRNKVLGPSNFMTLYLWMVMHPQIRFEHKVLRHSDGGTDDAKENWASLGSWAANNIQKGTWRRERINEEDQKIQETVIPKFIRPTLVYDALREEGSLHKVLFDYFVEKGSRILRNPSAMSHESLYNEIVNRKVNGGTSWSKLPASPFVNYRFDRLRWANTIYSVFKKGPEATGKIPLPDIAEASRMLELTSQEKLNLLIMLYGVNVKKPTIEPAEGKLNWIFDINSIKRAQPDLFRTDSVRHEL